jgi:hypothetical protein
MQKFVHVVLAQVILKLLFTPEVVNDELFKNLFLFSHLKKDRNGSMRICLNKTIKTVRGRTILMRKMLS